MSSEFSNFVSKDWGSEDLSDTDQWRVTMFIITLLVDIFDVYEKVEKGFVEENHLKMRMHALKLGIMKTKRARGVWDFWKLSRDQKFIDWFESEIYEDDEEYLDTSKISSALKSSVR